MASENRTEYKVVADKIVSPDNNINFSVSGNVYIGAAEAGNRVATVSDIGEGGGLPTDFTNVASNVVPSQDNTYSLGSDQNRWKELFLGPGTIYITDSATGEDVAVSVSDGVFNVDGIAQAQLPVIVVDEVRFSDNTVQTTAGGSGSADTGDITFVGTTISTDTGNDIVIQNKSNSNVVKSRITLDQSNEQVLIEAINGNSSGFTTSDWATATWSGTVIQITGTANGVIAFFNNLNGNVTHIQINNDQTVRYDGAGYGPDDITINTIETAPAESDPVTITAINFIYGVTSKIDINYDNEEFLVESVGMDINIDSTNEINLSADDDIDLNATNRVRVYGDTNVFLNSSNGGVFIGTSVENDNVNQVATLGDLSATSGVAFQSVRYTPNFTATDLAFSGSDTTHPTYNSHYVKQGQLVSFWIHVDMATVTNFGTDQYKVELPFAPLAGTMNHFSGWVQVDETANPDLAGHIIVNADHLANTSVLDLHYIKQSGGANSPVMEAILKQNTPVVMTTATHIYINGTYIAAAN